MGCKPWRARPRPCSWTCVWLAATAGSVDVLRLLIRQYKCDLDVDHQDSSPLEALCSYDGGAALLHGPRLECATLSYWHSA
mmetsp:Transcript_83447/g.235265  ORF Transcript_83447/g.235265 Transcript_83447/m.235265 type:complete len:81 (-) Transcript_83447:335-577(-)